MSDKTIAKPANPRLVLLVALFPGAGHVMLGMAMRGLQFIFFTVILGWVSHKLMPPDASFVGRNIGGIFVWGLSVLDAYKIAAIKARAFRDAGRDDTAA